MSDFILRVESFEKKYVIIEYLLHSKQLKQYMVTIVVDQSLSNIAMYENSCLENIKKLYITTGKYDGKQQYKTIIEAEMVWTADGFTNNSQILAR